MAGINQYLPFAHNSGATVQSPTTYGGESLRGNGHQPGVARVEVANTTWRQTSVAAAGIAALVVQEVPSSDMLDDGSVNNFRDKLKAALLEIIADNQYWSTGDVKSTLDPADQPGWVFANGANISRTGANAALFAKFGTTYGAGDGSTTFGIPDLRGEFLRGHDAGRGVDPSRVLGTVQPEMIGPHTHPTDWPMWDEFERTNNHMASGGNIAETQRFQLPTNFNAGTENRPRNVAVRYLIKL